MNRHYDDRVRDKVRTLYAADVQSVAHRMEHIERVLVNTRKIAAHFPDTDWELLTLAALLHDVTSPFNRKEEHMELSMETARDILNEIGYPPEKSERVLSIIGEHSTERLKTGNLSSVEARILFDADKIDGIGPNGIARAFALFGQRGYAPPSAITWYRKKIEKSLRNMKTVPGRKMAMERLPYVEDFLHRFEEENAGLPETKKHDENKDAVAEIPDETVVKDLLKPVANIQRFQILKALTVQTRTFSDLSQMTGLRGGNLLFHIKKLTDSGMILQCHERGDYIITDKGFKTMTAISDLHKLLNSNKLL